VNNVLALTAREMMMRSLNYYSNKTFSRKHKRPRCPYKFVMHYRAAIIIFNYFLAKREAIL
jgi:hypothetical protein